LEYFQEAHGKNGKLYNRDVVRLLFKYIFTYRKYLIIALILVLFITGANLSVPLLFKTIVDRFVFTQGRIIDTGFIKSEENRNFITKRVKRTVPLTGSLSFVYQADLKYLSKNEIAGLISSGALSSKRYCIVQSSDAGSVLREKLEQYRKKGSLLMFGDSIYLFEVSIMRNFTVSEISRLRANDFTHITQYILFIAGILFVQFASSYLQIIFLMRLSQYAMKDLRKDLYAHVLSLAVSYFDKNAVGKLVTRVTNDIEKLNELFSSVLITFFQDILMMLGIAVIMFLTSFTLALIVAVAFPFLILFTLLFRIKVRNAYRTIRTKISELNSFLNETITGIRIIQIFVREVYNFRKFLGINTGVYNAQLRQLYVNAVFRPLIGFMRWFAIAAVIYFGARGIVQNRVSYGLLVMFIAYIERFFHPVQDLSEKFDIMQSATAAGEKIISLFNADAVNEREENSRRLKGVKREPAMDKGEVQESPGFEGRIEFKDVWFSYIPGEWVLRGVSFTVNPRETLAIVGETGAGKSTIISILSKFYRFQKGQILIDGKNLDTLSYSLVRRNIIPVMQDVFLFSGSVRENVTLGNVYDAERFQLVSGMTHINQFIKNLPGKEEEQVMERGATFSAGERQLLSFARALYFDPSILVLDEATSNIDTETEKLIQDAIIGLMRGRTSIVIAHRLSTIMHADKIIVLEKGKIVEEGRHQELLTKRGIYHRLYTLQFGLPK